MKRERSRREEAEAIERGRSAKGMELERTRGTERATNGMEVSSERDARGREKEGRRERCGGRERKGARERERERERGRERDAGVGIHLPIHMYASPRPSRRPRVVDPPSCPPPPRSTASSLLLSRALPVRGDLH